MKERARQRWRGRKGSQPSNQALRGSQMEVEQEARWRAQPQEKCWIGGRILA